MSKQEPKPVVLAVDDTPENLDVVKGILARDYVVKAAINGKIALKIAEAHQPDLILLDIMMPEMDGYEVCEVLKSNPATEHIPVIFVSALDHTADKVKGLDLGAVDYISKPFEAAEVIARVHTHLTMYRLRQELARSNDELKSANERMHRDLQAAARAQHALLPTSMPETEQASFAWQYHPCDELAGDSLNIHRLGPHHVSLYVVDVMGHGVPAALLSVTVTRALAPNLDPSSLVTKIEAGADERTIVDPATVLGRLNELYPMESNDRRFLTMIYGILDLESGVFKFAIAGHPGPIVIRRDAAPEHLEIPGLPIGIVQGAAYSNFEIQLDKGDRLYLFSDGLCEEADDTEEEFGAPRLMASLAAAGSGSIEASLESVRQELVAWHGGESFTDDFSILAAERK